MEELNLTELLRYYLKKSPIIILTTILALLIGYLYIEEFQVPLYHGTTTIILVQKNEGEVSSAITQNELTVNEKLVSTYSQIIKSRRVLDQVIDSLELDTTTSSLAEDITVTSVSETSIIKVSVSNEDNKEAVKIANKIAEVFKEEVSKIYNLENISVIDEATIEKTPYNINVPKQMIIYALVGIVLSCGVIFIMFYFDNTIKSKKEIESKLNLPVLGEIPVAKKLTLEESKRRKKKREQKKLKKQQTKENVTVSKEEEKVVVEKEETPKKDSKKTTTKKTTSKKASSPKTTTTKKNTSTEKKTQKEGGE